MRRVILVSLVLLAAACRPAVAPAPPLPPRPCIDPHSSVDQAIDCAFGSLGLARQDEAHRVAWCESRKNPAATNGQYRGLFQLGSNYDGTIAHYGGNPFDSWVNAQTARDSVAANNGWIRWQCKP